MATESYPLGFLTQATSTDVFFNLAGCSKRPFSEAADESKPEAYPLGYVEDFDETRTKLTVVFSIVLKVQRAGDDHDTLPPNPYRLNDIVVRINLHEDAGGPIHLITLLGDNFGHRRHFDHPVLHQICA